MRPARPDDLDTLVALEQMCEGPSAWSAALIAAGLDATVPTTKWLIHPDGIAYAVVAVVDDVAELQRIGTHSGHRRSGLARQMLAAAIGVATDRGASRMLLEVRASNTPAVALYLSSGFTEIARRRRYYADGETAIVMERDLDD